MQQIRSDLKPVSETVPENSAGKKDSGSTKSNLLSLIFRRAIIFILVLVYFGTFVPLGLDFHHDGVMFIPALRVASGEMVFRDVYCQYGFLSPVLQGFSLWLGGNELLVMKYFSVLFYAGSAILLDIIWQRFLTPRWRDLLLIMYFILMPDQAVTFHAWSSVFALFFSLVSAALLLSFLSGKRRYTLAGAGIFAGITFLSRHPVGVITLLAVVISLFFDIMLTGKSERNWKNFAVDNTIAAGGFLLPIGGTAILLIACGAWDDFVLQCISYVFGFVHSRGGQGSWNYLAESLMPFLTDNGFLDSIFATLPLFALYWLFKAVRPSSGNIPASREQRSMLAALAIFALGAWHQYYPVPCVRHLFWGGIPFFGFFALSIRALWQYDGKYKIPAKATAIICLLHLALCSSNRVYWGYNRFTDMPKRIVSNIPGIRGVKQSKGEARTINYLRSNFDQLPEQIRKRGVLNYTRDGLWSVILPDAGFRHPQFIRIDSGLYPDYNEKIMHFIKAKQPVVLSSKPVYLENYWPAAHCEYMGEAYTLWVPAN